MMRTGQAMRRPRERVCWARAKEVRSEGGGGGRRGGWGADILGRGSGGGLGIGQRKI